MYSSAFYLFIFFLDQKLVANSKSNQKRPCEDEAWLWKMEYVQSIEVWLNLLF